MFLRLFVVVFQPINYQKCCSRKSSLKRGLNFGDGDCFREKILFQGKKFLEEEWPPKSVEVLREGYLHRP